MSRLKIAHLSDPHFGTILPGVTEGLIASLQEIAPDLILITGDITQRARARQFRAAKAFTHALKPTPFIAVPGNHDIPLFNIFVRLFDPYRGFRKLFKDQLEKDFVYGDVAVIGLASTSRWRHIQGDFDIPRIRKRFAAHKFDARVRIAAFHHPMDCAKYIDEKNLLRGRENAMTLFDQAQVDLVVGGHIHDPYITLSDDRYPHVRRRMILAVAGTCLSWRTRVGAPNSFNLIEVATDQTPRITISRMDIGANQRFTPNGVHHFERGDGGWSPG
ncbi:MAG TPA: metallophosphoesterase, partial [Bdellovibrionales bacterium]|nr:metallophosphoesterase [Bdellovibrionales bacterium]